MIDSSVAEIATQAADQSTGLKLINIAMTEIDQSTKLNASMAEEATAASQSLSRECARLLQMVDNFQLHAASGAPDEHISGRSKTPQFAA